MQYKTFVLRFIDLRQPQRRFLYLFCCGAAFLLLCQSSYSTHPSAQRWVWFLWGLLSFLWPSFHLVIEGASNIYVIPLVSVLKGGYDILVDTGKGKENTECPFLSAVHQCIYVSPLIPTGFTVTGDLEIYRRQQAHYIWLALHISSTSLFTWYHTNLGASHKAGHN